MHIQKYQPQNAALKQVVKYFVIWQSKDAIKDQIVLPGSESGLGFTLSGTLKVNYNGAWHTAPSFGTRNIFCAGTQVKISENFYNISVRFNAYGLSCFTNLHLAEAFQHHFIPVHDVIKTEYVEKLTDSLQNIKDDLQKIELIENFLLLHLNNRPVNQLCAATSLLEKTNGEIKVSSLAKQLNTSERQLHRLFTQNVGIGVKEMCRILRFKHLLAQMTKGGKHIQNFASYSYQNGYADQSHAIKDFKYFTGLTPALFIKKDTAMSDFYNT